MVQEPAPKHRAPSGGLARQRRSRTITFALVLLSLVGCSWAPPSFVLPTPRRS